MRTRKKEEIQKPCEPMRWQAFKVSKEVYCYEREILELAKRIAVECQDFETAVAIRNLSERIKSHE